MTTQQILDRLVTVGPPIINALTKPGEPHCVLSTAVGQMVLARLGIPAEPYVVQLTVVNKAWVEWAEAGFPGGREEQLRRGAYIITNRPDWNGPSFTTRTLAAPWDGHLVVRVPNGDQTWLLDLDVGSFNRPLRNIKLPAGLVAPLHDGLVEGTFTVGTIETTVSYRPLVAPYADDYQTARDWAERGRFTPLVEKVVRAMGKIRAS